MSSLDTTIRDPEETPAIARSVQGGTFAAVRVGGDALRGRCGRFAGDSAVADAQRALPGADVLDVVRLDDCVVVQPARLCIDRRSSCQPLAGVARPGGGLCLSRMPGLVQPVCGSGMLAGDCWNGDRRFSSRRGDAVGQLLAERAQSSGFDLRDGRVSRSVGWASVQRLDRGSLRLACGSRAESRLGWY